MAGRPSTANAMAGVNPRTHHKGECMLGFQKWLADINQSVHTLKLKENERLKFVQSVDVVRKRIVRLLRGSLSDAEFDMANRCICEICAILLFLDERDLAFSALRFHMKTVNARGNQWRYLRLCHLIIAKIWRAKNKGDGTNREVLFSSRWHVRQILESDENMLDLSFARTFWEPCQSYVDYQDGHISFNAFLLELNLLWDLKKFDLQYRRGRLLRGVLSRIVTTMPSDPSSGCVRLVGKAYLTLGLVFFRKEPSVARFDFQSAITWATKVNDRVTIIKSRRHHIRVDVRDRNDPFEGLEQIGLNDNRVITEELCDSYAIQLREMLEDQQEHENPLQVCALTRDMNSLGITSL
eukprot:GILJ01014207.1.p1 GENE.GILJ01014207.1~~GILJ01014207.1.p1  ORF type:complete len:364 (+),score=20.63 GILJ01014207.1:36-1094(+)